MAVKKFDSFLHQQFYKKYQWFLKSHIQRKILFSKKLFDLVQMQSYFH